MRLERRAAARVQRRRRRALFGGGAGVVALVVVLVAVLASSGSDDHGRNSGTTGKAKAHAIVDGGPVAPAAFGGLAALWARQNVVGYGPTTGTAYQAASERPGLPGDLMIADRGNNRIVVVDSAGHILFRYPEPGEHSLFFDDDTFVEPGGEWVISNEEDNHAIIAVNLVTRQFKLLFGHPGSKGSDSTHLNEPDDAYALPDGTFTVADASNCRVLFIREQRIVRRYGSSLECRHDPPHRFASVNGDTPVPGGGVLVSEIAGNWVDEVGPEGRLRWATKAPVSYPSDPQPLPGGRVLLADYSSPGHVLITDQRGKVLWRYGPSGGYGRLDHPSLAMALPNGDIAVNDDFRDRVIVIDPRLNRIVRH